MRMVWKGLLVSSVVAAACASQSSDSGARLAALESRMTRIEDLLTRDASVVEPVPVVPDAGAQVVTTPVPQVVRASDAGVDVATQIAECKQSAEMNCANRVYMERLSAERAKKGAIRWVEIPKAPADSTPQGRACLKREYKRCDDSGKPEPVFVWLDAQLVPGKADEKLTKEMRERVAKQLNVPPEKLDIVCAPQFCRIIGDHRHVSLGDDFNHGISSGPRSYLMRRGFEISQ